MMMFSNEIHFNVRNGIQLFNQKDFYGSHGFFEDAWRETADDSREFFRALLQISAGHFRLTQNRPTATRKFFRRAHYWLKPFSEDHLGFKVESLRSYLYLLINAIEHHLPLGYILLKNLFNPIIRLS